MKDTDRVLAYVLSRANKEGIRRRGNVLCLPVRGKWERVGTARQYVIQKVQKERALSLYRILHSSRSAIQTVATKLAMELDECESETMSEYAFKIK